MRYTHLSHNASYLYFFRAQLPLQKFWLNPRQDTEVKKKGNDFTDFMKSINNCGFCTEYKRLKNTDNFELFEFQLDPKKITYINNFVFETK